MNRKKIIIGALIILVLAGIGLFLSSPRDGAKEQKTLTPITVQFSWLHTVEFAGFYMAEKLGYYEDAGLLVTLNPIDFGKKPEDQVISGEAQIGVISQDKLLFVKEEGMPLKAIASIYQKTPFTLISLKEKGIKKPEDLRGKRIALECGFAAEFLELDLIQKAGIGEDEYTKVCSTFDIKQLINDEVDVMAGFIENEPLLLEVEGNAVNNIVLDDYGYFFYPNLLFTTNEMILNNAEIIQKFLDATLRGYRYAIDHEEEAVLETLLYDEQLGKQHQRVSMTKQIPLLITGENPLGWIDANGWEKGYRTLFDAKRIHQEFDFKEIVDDRFLKDIYQ